MGVDKRKTAEVSYRPPDPHPERFESADAPGLRRLRFSFFNPHCQRAIETPPEGHAPNP